MRAIRGSNVTVVLDGQGGDELFCGYAKFFYFYLRDMLRNRRLGQLTATLILALFNGGSHLLDFNAARRYLPRQLNRSYGKLLCPDFENQYLNRYEDRTRGELRIQQILDIKKFSLPVLLRYEDKNSMAYSIESRVPFLDHRLVEFALALPAEHKLYGGQAKRIMRYALADKIPAEVLRRRTKLGFGGSFSSWIGDLEISFEKWIDSHSQALDHYIQPLSLKGLLYRRDPSLFRILILDKWLERFGYS
jgi:asparagine synthase (glutamine-hydrolysing)